MSYSFTGRVRYSEIGENGCLTLPGILDYFQDCCTFHSEDIGQGMEVLKKRNRAWVLASWQVVVNRMPALGEELVVSTYPYEFKGFMGMRNFTMDTRSGERLAYANTSWTNLNTETGFPERLTDADVKGYVREERLEMEYAPRKIAVPKERESRDPFVVQKHQLDTNHHVNNCQYVVMAADYLPEGFSIRQMRAEYKRQAVLGDVFYPQVAWEEGRLLVVLGAGGGTPYAIVEFC
ncbi:MAG: thioesterase [Eubacteriales bacterium]|nr:thioesterase [Eubacteriales bacterium]